MPGAKTKGRSPWSSGAVHVKQLQRAPQTCIKLKVTETHASGTTLIVCPPDTTSPHHTCAVPCAPFRLVEPNLHFSATPSEAVSPSTIKSPSNLLQLLPATEGPTAPGSTRLLSPSCGRYT